MRNALLALISWLCLAGLAPPPSASMLAWMSGDWVVEQGESWTQEHWSMPRGDLMLGLSSSGRGEKANSFEYMRISRDAEGWLTFWGSPGGAPAVAFRAVTIHENEVAFENPAHDFPTRISYSRSDDTLTATVSGPGGANAQSWVYRKAAR